MCHPHQWNAFQSKKLCDNLPLGQEWVESCETRNGVPKPSLFICTKATIRKIEIEINYQEEGSDGVERKGEIHCGIRRETLR